MCIALRRCCSRPAPCCGACAGSLPWSGWLTALSFNAVVALYLENSSQETHVAHVAGGFLLIYALWYHFYRREIREADREGRFWRTALYPRWVYSLSVFYLGLFYGMSGFNKIAVSGVGRGPTACRCNCGRSCSETKPPYSRK